LLLLIAATVFAVNTLVGAYRAAPASAITALDEAFRNADCAALVAVTSEKVRAQHFSTTGQFSCSEFEQIAAALTRDGEYGYTITITSTEVDGDQATATSQESDEVNQNDWDVDYGMDLVDGNWVITSYVVTASEG
jgi:hypothetical protein